MKLKAHWVMEQDLQRYLDKYQDRIKFITHYITYYNTASSPDKFLVIVDEE